MPLGRDHVGIDTIKLVNEIRAKDGLPPLPFDDQLDDALERSGFPRSAPRA